MKPIRLEFIVKGDIEKELARVQLAVKGVGDESYTSFKRLLGSSNEAFNGLSRGAQGQAVILQRVIQELRQNEAAQDALWEKFERNKISSDDYAQAQARLSVQQAELKRQASELNKELEREIQLNGKVSDSLEQKISYVASLRAEYSKLTQEERDNEQVGGKIVERVKLLSQEIDSINGRFRKEKEVVTLVSGSLQEKMATLAKLREEYSRLNPAERENEQIGGKLEKRIKTLNQEIEDINTRFRKEKELVTYASGSLLEKQVILAKLREEYARLNKEERENEKIGGQLLNRIRELDRELKNIGSGLKETKVESSSLADTLEQIPGPIGSGVSLLKQFLTAGKAFMSSGIGMFVAGLTTLFYGLKTAIEGSEEATTKMNAVVAYSKSIWSTQKKMLTEMAAGIYNLLMGNIDAANKNASAFQQLQLNQVEYAKLNAKASEEQVRINKLQERNNGLILANSSAIAQYRTQLMDVNKTFEERKKIGQEILKLEKENANLELQPIAENYYNYIKLESETFRRISEEFPRQTELANKYFKTLTDGGELSLTQQHELINAINDITAGLDKGWDDEKKAKFRSYFTDALTVTKEYYSKSREVSTNLSNIIKQQANETARANKKTALQKLEEEVKLYKEQYAILYAYERNMGKEAADEAFKDLKAKGGDFIAYLSNKINELQNKPNRTKDDDVMLGYLQKTRQETAPKFDAAAFKQSIEEKKKLYKEDIEGYLAYLEKLRKLMEQDTGTAGTQKRIVLDLEIKETKEEQQKNLDDLLKNYRSFTVKMSSLEKNYQRDMSRLAEAGQKATTDYDKKRYQDAMDARTDAYDVEVATLISENSSFAEVLFGDMERISRSALKKAISEAKAFIEEWKKRVDELTPEMKSLLNNIEQGIRGAEQESASRLPEDLQAAATALQDCATMAEAFDSNLADVCSTAADAAQAASHIAGGIAQIGTGNFVQGAASILTGITGFITGIGKRIKENKKIRQEYLQSLVETYSKEMEYNAILRERLRTQQQIGESSLQYFGRMQKELEKQKGAINKEYQEVWGKLMGENYISGTGYKHGTWFRKAKTWNEYSSLAGKTYDEIESLYTADKLDGAAKTLFERLKQLKEEGADVVEMMDNLKEEMREAWTGTTSSAITDSIAQGLLDGKRSAADFADDFRDLMRNAMMQGIKMKYLEAPLQEWYTRFAEASENGLTTDKIEELRRQYDAIIQSAANEAEALEKITGVQLGEEATRSAVAKGIQSVSQDSFNEFMGSVNALLYITSGIDKNVSNIQNILYQAAAKWIEIEENTRYCRRLDGIDLDIKEMKNGISSLVNNGILLRNR
ncbi:hypothetical protein [Parabacteroides sp. AM08-6]|uniref:hypothetical protein n=1 Tax=Parabacteroides sp. AM08-6 TaxID=2292053 RepID=UPI000EFF3641|nr:hypothetical protein [Parabacteroides sp. AM08-6]RHJ75752.1 hypothetical protein DW103_17415 [Parabacteroides sp. AM08-6]